jgi:hypothetical protein
VSANPLVIPREHILRGMDLPRVAWTVTVLVALLTGALLLLAGYTGYAALSVTVGASAAINLF